MNQTLGQQCYIQSLWLGCLENQLNVPQVYYACNKNKGMYNSQTLHNYFISFLRWPSVTNAVYYGIYNHVSHCKLDRLYISYLSGTGNHFCYP